MRRLREECVVRNESYAFITSQIPFEKWHLRAFQKLVSEHENFCTGTSECTTLQPLLPAQTDLADWNNKRTQTESKGNCSATQSTNLLCETELKAFLASILSNSQSRFETEQMGYGAACAQPPLGSPLQVVVN